MFVKIATMVLMAIIATSKGEKVWDGFSARWDRNGKDAFYTLPQSLKDAESQGWTEIFGVEAEHSMKAMGYYGDPRFVLYFAKCTGKVLGLQVGIPMADIGNPEFPLNYSANSAMRRKTLNGEEYYTATAFYQENEQKGTREIWVEVDGKLVEIPTKADLLTQKTSFYLKRCLKWMGLHYYQIDSTLDCTVMFPWVPLRVGNDIIGIAFQTIANPTTASKRKWFEDVPRFAILALLPDAPACLVDGLDKYGSASIHVYFKKDPLNIICQDECTAVYNSTYGNEQPHHQSGQRYKRALGSGNVCPV